MRSRMSSRSCVFVERLRLTVCMANSASRLTNGPMTLLMRSTRISPNMPVLLFFRLDQALLSRLISSVTSTELTLSQISCPRRDGVRIQFLNRSRIKISLPFSCFFAVLPVMIA